MKRFISFVLVCAMILGTASMLNVPKARAETDEVSVPMASVDPGDPSTAIVLRDNNYYGVHFKSAAAFSGVHFMKWTPGWNDGGCAEYTLAVYTWDTDFETSISSVAVSSVSGEMNTDGEIDIRFAAVPAGEYVLVLTVNKTNAAMGGSGVHLQTSSVQNGQDYFERFTNATDNLFGDRFAAFQLIVNGAASDVFEQIDIPKVVRFSSVRSDLPENIKTPYEDYAFRFTVPEGYLLKNLTLDMSPTWGASAVNSSLQVKVYKWTADYSSSVSGDVLNEVNIPSHADMQNLVIDFDAELPADTYLIVLKATYNGDLDFPEGSIGFWWGTPEEGLEDYAFTIYRNGGTEEITLAAWPYLPYGSVTMVKSAAENDPEPSDKLVPMTSGDPGDPSSAIVLGAGNYYGVHFKTNTAFSGVHFMKWTPGGADGLAEYTLSAYAWDQDYETSVSAAPAASVKGQMTGDGEIDIRFESSVPAGEYVVVFAVDTVSSVMTDNNTGVHLQTGTVQDGQELFERFANAIIDNFADRFAAFRLIIDGSVENTDIFEQIDIPETDDPDIGDGDDDDDPEVAEKLVPMTSGDPGDPVTAIVLGAGGYYGVHFKSTVAFNGVHFMQWTPGGGEGLAEYTLSAYIWNQDYETSIAAEAISSVNGKTAADGEIDIRFENSVPAGEYVLVLTVNSVNDELSSTGLHIQTAEVSDGQEYFERFTNATMNFFDDRFAAFLLITEGLADDSDAFEAIEFSKKEDPGTGDDDNDDPDIGDDDDDPEIVEKLVPMTSGDPGDPGSAIVLGAGGYYGVHFKSSVPFIGVHFMQWTPGGADGLADYTLSAYTWNKDYASSVSAAAAATVNGQITGDGEIDIRFESMVPAGEYVLVLTVNKVSSIITENDTGLHLQTGEVPEGQEYFERFTNADKNLFGDRFAAFLLITDGSADDADVFKPIDITNTEIPGSGDKDDDKPENTERLVPMTSGDPGDPGNAVVLGAGDYYGVHFKSAVAFNGVHFMQWTPGGGEGLAAYTLSAYKWNRNYETSVASAAVASVSGQLTADGEIDIRFESSVPAGEYVLVLTVNAVNDVLSGSGVHLQTGVVQDGQEYFERFTNAAGNAFGDRFAAFRLITVGAETDDVFAEIYVPKDIRLSAERVDPASKAPYNIRGGDYALKLTIPEGYSLKSLVLYDSPTWEDPADICSIQFRVYRWNTDYATSVSGSVLAETNILSHENNTDLVVNFNANLSGGTYLIVMHATGEGNIGFWWGTRAEGLESYAVTGFENGIPSDHEYIPDCGITIVNSNALDIPNTGDMQLVAVTFALLMAGITAVVLRKKREF